MAQLTGTATSSALGDALYLVYRDTNSQWIQQPGTQGFWVVV